MRLLLDAHTFIWASDNPEKLGRRAHSLLEAPSNDLFFSSATIWEIGIKVGIQKLQLSISFKEWMPRAIDELQITILPISIEAVDLQSSLPNKHQDPFDRLLVAQALVEQMQIITKDPKIASYDVDTQW